MYDIKLSEVETKMVATVSIRDLVRKSKFIGRIILLAVIILYVLPQLIILLWDTSKIDPKGPDQHLLEKPLRVQRPWLDTSII